jgi:4-hydroxybenzoate polyprenyltransferase
MVNQFCFFPLYSLMTNFMNSSTPPLHTDIKAHGWWHWLPPASHPFIYLARLDRPIGWWLLLLPGWWSISLGAPSFDMMLWVMALFFVGAIVTRAAGCIINDMWDRRLDQQIARTSARPLAAGTISTAHAGLFLMALSLVGLFVLIQLPRLAIYVGFAATPLVVFYPLAKRVTWFPQFVLGLTFSWGVFLGWTAVTASLPPFSVTFIYVGCVFWVFGYDTIYAIQDMEDDRAVGIKSSALAFKDQISLGIGTAYVIAIGLIAVGLFLHGNDEFQSVILGWVGLAGMAIHLGIQIQKIRIDNAELALKLFKSNRNAGLLLLAGLVLDRLFTG